MNARIVMRAEGELNESQSESGVPCSLFALELNLGYRSVLLIRGAHYPDLNLMVFLRPYQPDFVDCMKLKKGVNVHYACGYKLTVDIACEFTTKR